MEDQEVVVYVSPLSRASVRLRALAGRLEASARQRGVRIVVRDVSRDLDAAVRDHVLFTPTVIARVGGATVVTLLGEVTEAQFVGLLKQMTGDSFGADGVDRLPEG